MGVLLAEHRLERCLAAADRVIALDSGRVALRRLAPRLLRVGARRRSGARAPRCAPVLARRARAAAGLGEGGPGGAGGSPRGGRSGAAGPDRRSARRAGCGGDRATRAARSRCATCGSSSTRGSGRGRCCAGSSSRSSRGERVALMGRNGAGKSTLLRAAAGLVGARPGIDPGAAGCALLPQSPTDLLVRERVGDELPGEAGRRGAGGRRARVGDGERPARPLGRRARAPRAGAGDGRPRYGRVAGPRLSRRADPRHGRGPQARALRLDRRARRARLGGARRHTRRRVRRPVRLAGRAARRRRADRRRPGGRDPLRRLVLRHRGRPHPWRDGGDHARAGRRGPARPEPGRGWRARELAGCDVHRPGAGARRRLLVVRALAPDRPPGRPGRGARRAGGRGAAGARADPQRRGDHGHRAPHRLRARRRARVRRGRAGGADLQPLARPGAVDGLADGGVGAGRPRRCLAGDAQRAAPRPARAGDRVRGGRVRLRGAARPLGDGHLRWRAVTRPLPRALGPRASRSTWPTRWGTSRSRSPPARRWCG